MRILLTLLIELLLAATQALSSAAPDSAIVAWLRASAIALDGADDLPPEIDRCFADVRVVGLGEATHGQHESFELKRRLTLHLVREHGFRLVAFEASSTTARACDDYVAGRGDDVLAALRGMGMLIWSIEENAALLDDLRAWNALVGPEARVRFVGVDVQDAQATAGRLRALLAGPDPDLATRAGALGARIEAARTALFAGDASAFDALWPEVEELRGTLEERRAALAERSSPADADEACARGRELARCMSAARVPSGRDRAMAETLLEELERAGAATRAVLWAHNGHVTNGPLRYLDSTDPGIGGVLRESLGEGWYAVGFLFGEGGFHALVRDAERGLGFRSYSVSSAPAGSLEAPFVAAGLGTAFVDLRRAPAQGDVALWLDSGHGQRWFGGSGIPDDVEATSRDVARLPVTVPRQDFDGMVFLPRTTPARPIDPARVLPAPGRAAR